jgi:hypothetical protein
MGRVRYSVVVSYQPMSLAELARFIAAEPDFDTRWRLVVEFLKEYHQEPAGMRRRLLADAPGPTGDERWDVLFAGLAEHLAMRDGKDAPGWSASRGLRRFWFPFDTPGARAGARACSGRVPQAGRVRRRLRDRRRVSDPSPLLDRAGLRVFAASPEHLLAMKALAARPRDAEDIRQLTQVLDLHTVDDVLASMREIFPEEEPPARLRLLLEDIFSDQDG